MARTYVGRKTDDDNTRGTTTYELGSGYSKSGRKLPSNAEEAIAAGRYLDDDGYWRTSSGYKLRTGTSQGGGYTTYDGIGGGVGGKNSIAGAIGNAGNTGGGNSSVSQLYSYVNGQGGLPQYTDYYDLREIIDKLKNTSYEDWAEGDEYAALAERYGLLGNQAMQNTLGQVANRTGGLASSYAQTVANQQYNDYMSQLEDVARSMYESDRSELEDQYKYMSDYNDTMYDRYRDSLSDYTSALAAAQKTAATKKSGTDKTGTSDDETDGPALNEEAAATVKTILENLFLPGTKKKSSASNAASDTGNSTQTTPTYDLGNHFKSIFTAGDVYGNSAAKGTGNGASGTTDSTKKATPTSSVYPSNSKVRYNPVLDSFTFNGKTYDSIGRLEKAMENANLTDAEIDNIAAYLKQQGFNVNM